MGSTAPKMGSSLAGVVQNVPVIHLRAVFCVVRKGFSRCLPPLGLYQMGAPYVRMGRMQDLYNIRL